MLLNEAVGAALPATTALVVADADAVLVHVLARLRGAAADEAIVVLIQPDFAAIDRAMLIAALGPLALELAPRRINAIAVADGAASERVVAAARYLAFARSTTGQNLVVG